MKPVNTPHTMRYEISPGIVWAVEHDGILVRDNLTLQWSCLAYPEAAVWDLLSRGCTLPETTAAVRWIAAVTPTEAEVLVAHHVKRWLEEDRIRPWRTFP